MPSPSRMTLIPLVAAWVASAYFVFKVGVDWGFVPVLSSVATAGLLSLWAAVPYLILWPLAWRAIGLAALFVTLASLLILSFGALEMRQAMHTPGDEGGSYIVVPLQQTFLACVARLIWAGLRTRFSKVAP